MKLSAKNLKNLFKRKIATAVLITASVAAFATLGDGGGEKRGQKKSNNHSRFSYSAKNFSLRSGYNYKGNNVLNQRQQFIMLNTTVTYQKGNATYILPLKKKVILDKVKFNPPRKNF